MPVAIRLPASTLNRSIEMVDENKLSLSELFKLNMSDEITEDKLPLQYGLECFSNIHDRFSNLEKLLDRVITPETVSCEIRLKKMESEINELRTLVVTLLSKHLATQLESSKLTWL
jgi:hypothetical protein